MYPSFKHYNNVSVKGILYEKLWSSWSTELFDIRYSINSLTDRLPTPDGNTVTNHERVQLPVRGVTRDILVFWEDLHIKSEPD